jgi:outer membrane protein OmpA-like peptidoglycan-associated protein
MVLFVALTLWLSGAAMAQDLGGSVAAGIRGGITHYIGDGFATSKQRAFGSIYGEQYLSDAFSLEAAFALGELAGETGSQEFVSRVGGASLLGRFALIPGEEIRPYVAAGIEGLGIDPKDDANQGFDRSAFAVPVGGGFSFSIGENTALDLRGLYHYSFKNRLDGLRTDSDDSFITATLGLTRLFRANKDQDGDGLLDRDEKARGTNPKVADTDGDGLSDGEEALTYRTDPLKADSDGDGLSDADEIRKHKTDANKADSDGDGLSDGKEVMTHNTDAMKADTDGDGLNDGDELMTHKTDANQADSDGDGLKDGAEVNTNKTNPMMADSDGDGLSDGEEVNQYRTNPLKPDTDDGTVNDAVEVKRGTNPLVAADDIPKKEVIQVEAGAAIVLEGVVFASGSAQLTPSSEAILGKAFNTLEAYPEMQVEIQGHTDNRGNAAANMKLSQARADAVKAWLMKKGIAAERIGAKGLGQDQPIASNDTLEGRQKNRRIEFYRTK